MVSIIEGYIVCMKLLYIHNKNENKPYLENSGGPTSKQHHKLEIVIRVEEVTNFQV